MNFKSKNEIKWCPGCGNYAILNSMQKFLSFLGIVNENVVFITGIGCAGRFSYYIDTYGFHTIHGRAPAVAMGLKMTRPELSVWLVVGDGDGFGIGIGHIIHAFRRNCDINILLFNNQVYGLTKGQYSPTSFKGKRSRSSPSGSLENPINPIKIAIASGASFIARTVDNDVNMLKYLFYESFNNKGISFIEVLQNCIVFNDKSFNDLYNFNLGNDNSFLLKHKEPLIFGNKKDKFLDLDKNFKFTIKNISDLNFVDSFFYDIYKDDFVSLISDLNYPNFPIPFGIFRNIFQDSYNNLYYKNNNFIDKDYLKKFFSDGYFWNI